MNFIVEHLNALGARALVVAWPIFWQSSLLIVLLLALEWRLGRKVRPGVRYVLWLVVLVKLVLPPSLALPTSVAWWIRPPAHATRPQDHAPAVVTYGSAAVPVASEPVFVPQPRQARLSLAGGAFGASVGVSLLLFSLVLRRWRQVARQAATHRGTPDCLAGLLEEGRRAAGLRRRVPLRLVKGPMSPALFGLLRPVILLPEPLTQRLSAAQLRPVLLHELFHLRRGDLWVNCVQALLQILYWWHPLVWAANNRIRRVREEAVDEAVMLALRGDAGTYAPTLLEVARLALPRPLASLGLVGILESHRALRQRIERLIEFQPPRRAGVTMISVLCAVTFGAVALPMGAAPEDKDNAQNRAAAGSPQISAGDMAGREKKTEAKVLVQDGKLLYEMGKLDEAEQKLRQALQRDPREQAAYYYLNLIKEARYKQQQRQGLRETAPGRRRIYSELNTLRLETVEFDGTPLIEVVKTLRAESKRLDPQGVGLNFVLSQASAPQAGPQELDKVTVRLLPALTNVRLVDVLDAIVKTADKPIKYSIEDYAVVFSFKSNEAPPLYTRMIKVDPNTFDRALRSVAGKNEPGQSRDKTKLLREFLSSINVDLTPPKSIFWNDREGNVLVRATLQDLDTIEIAIQALNVAPPQLTIKARFIEMSPEQEALFWQKHPGTQPSSSATRMTRLTSEEVQSQLDEWKSKEDVDLLSRSSVTTLSGRQAAVSVTDLKNIVSFRNSTGQLETNEVPFGPVLDVLPTISADTFRFDLAINATLTEFLGYGNPGQSSIGVKEETQRLQATHPIPHFRLVQLPATATVWDAETLVMGGGRQPAEKPGDHQKRLLVMVTPFAIDPAGNRMHTDEEIERARSQGGLWHPKSTPGSAR